MSLASDFTSIPVLDLSTLQTNRQQLLSDLQNALINVGFFYVKGHGISHRLLEELTCQTIKFFDLPLNEKLKVDKIHSPTFLGYSRQGNEITKGSKDNREQFDFANELPDAWTDNKPIYERLFGPNLWPTKDLAPDFSATILSFHQEAQKLAEQLTRLVSECLGLHPDALINEYLLTGQQNRAKLIKYPVVDQLTPQDGIQGVGAHRDTGSLLTILYQANNLPGLQVQNHSGNWIDAPPIPDTFVVNIGTGLAYLVHNVATATTHRVLNPPPGRGPRYSVPYFLSARMDKKLKPVEGIPKDILDKRPESVVTDSGHQFSHLYAENPGTYYLLNRISSHRDVGAEFYPEIAAKHGIKLGLNSGY
ncbi:putative isopenicillin N synthetase [Coemansia reversa NRRL 1564]|uniref:Putative isopenicillin N synthetase n=1 Tax=Coemansia reversa (strain ATCC 12441 / NRRL 1564) TaxID=763665 RepID=A0A2G5BAG8_COERN|nr:putative isopenicillin N synthetase [Coemansia reversa NRRL 1564]|eukprot:PIA16006.1 putative isopenicillin N synthetase [Coemansia reversa NRRL 1564]